MSKPRPHEKVNYVGTHAFTLDRRFSDFRLVGQGSYGVVCSAHDALLSKKIAIKKISPVTKHIDDAKHVLREIRLMRYLGKHENIVTLEDLIIRESADELYIVMELLDSDLHRVLQSKQPLTNNHLKYFFFQLIAGVKYLHDHRIIHRDLKPGNLLVTRDCRLRISDFGLAREKAIALGNVDESAAGEHEPMTEHVITRWYRPPELMLLPDGLYTYAVDMWSCGCILGEMLGRMPMFPGKNFIHQLTLIFDMIGSPHPSEIRHIQNPQACKFLETQMLKNRVSFASVYPAADREALNVMDSLLVFRPEKRATANELLYSSAYLASLTSNAKSASLRFPEISSRDFEFSFERESKITRLQLKSMIQHEVHSFHQEQFGGKENEKEKPRATSRGRVESNPKHQLASPDATRKLQPHAMRPPAAAEAQHQAQPYIAAAAAAAAAAHNPRPPPVNYKEYQHMLIERESKEEDKESADALEQEQQEDEKWLASLYAKAQQSLHQSVLPDPIAAAEMLGHHPQPHPIIPQPHPQPSKLIPGSILRPGFIPEPNASHPIIDRVTEQLQQQLHVAASTSIGERRVTISPPHSPIRPRIPIPLPMGQASPVSSAAAAAAQISTAAAVRKSIIVAKNIPPSKAIANSSSASPARDLVGGGGHPAPEPSTSTIAAGRSYAPLAERQPVNQDTILSHEQPDKDRTIETVNRPSSSSRTRLQDDYEYIADYSTAGEGKADTSRSFTQDNRDRSSSSTRPNRNSYKYHDDDDEEEEDSVYEKERHASSTITRDERDRKHMYSQSQEQAQEQNQKHARSQSRSRSRPVSQQRVEHDDDRSVNSTNTSRHRGRQGEEASQQQEYKYPQLERIALLKKKNLTIARSPKFSKMSWERKAEARAQGQAKAQAENHTNRRQTYDTKTGKGRVMRDHDADDAETVFSGTTVGDHPGKLSRNGSYGISATTRKDPGNITNNSKTALHRSSSAPRQAWKQL
jgi:serine/threonine protein kinase